MPMSDYMGLIAFVMLIVLCFGGNNTIDLLKKIIEKLNGIENEAASIKSRLSNLEKAAGIIENNEDGNGDDDENENGDDDEKLDKLLFEVAKWAIECGKGLSTSAVQRHFSVSYSRAGKIVDQLYGLGICSRSTGNSKPRAMLVDMESLKNLFKRLDRNENCPGKTEGL